MKQRREIAALLTMELVALSAVAAAGSPALAQAGTGGLGATTLYAVSRPPLPALPDEAIECMMGPNFPFEELKGHLALTDDQYQQIYNIECQYVGKIDPLLSQLKASSRQLRALLTGNSVDPDAVRQLQTQINQQRDQLANLFLEQQIASVQVLTPEQRAGLGISMIKSRKPHRWW